MKECILYKALKCGCLDNVIDSLNSLVLLIAFEQNILHWSSLVRKDSLFLLRLGRIQKTVRSTGLLRARTVQKETVSRRDNHCGNRHAQSYNIVNPNFKVKGCTNLKPSWHINVMDLNYLWRLSKWVNHTTNMWTSTQVSFSSSNFKIPHFSSYLGISKLRFHIKIEFFFSPPITKSSRLLGKLIKFRPIKIISITK